MQSTQFILIYENANTHFVDEIYTRIKDTSIDFPFVVTHTCRFNYQVKLFFTGGSIWDENWKAVVECSPWIRTKSECVAESCYADRLDVGGIYSDDYTYVDEFRLY